MRRLWLAIILAAVTAAALGAQQGTRPPASAAAQLEAATKKEVVDGDLKAAIELYRKLADGADRAVAAQALVRLGQCYEKLGAGQAAEARKAYERVIAQFGESAEAVAQAKARLEALSAPTAAAQGPSVRRVMSAADNFGDMENFASPDGRFYVDIDWETGDLASFEFATGTKRQLTAKSPGWTDPAFAATAAVSRDGRMVAYAWCLDKFIDSPWELRVMPVDRSQRPRTLFRSVNRRSPLAIAWFARGDRLLLVTLGEANGVDVTAIGAADGSRQVLKHFPAEADVRASHFVLSPDDRFLAFNRPQAPMAHERDVFAVALDSGAETPLVTHAADDFAVGWSPDGSRLLFGSDRAGHIDVWGVNTANGLTSGAPTVIRADVGRIAPRGVTNSGSIVYLLETSLIDIYTAGLDLEEGKVRQPPAVVDERTLGNRQSPAWSRDGRLFSYVRPERRAGAAYTLIVRTEATGAERSVPLSVGPVLNPRWSPDGRRLLGQCFSRETQSLESYIIDADTGAARRALSGSPTFAQYAVDWLPDGRSVLVWKAERDPGARGGFKPAQLAVRDLDSGAERVIYAPSTERVMWNHSLIALSPDGTRVTFTVGTPKDPDTPVMLKAIDTRGGEPSVVYRAPEGAFISGRDWTPDSRHLVFGVRNRSEAGQSDGPFLTHLWLALADGGAARDLGMDIDRFNVLRVSPDGRRLAWTAGWWEGELWMMEHVLPVKK